MVTLNKINRLVEDIYQPTFKTFNVNSKDGISLSSNLGYFVSLGLTTNISVINNVLSYLKSNLPGVTLSISKLRTKKLDNGLHINYIESNDYCIQFDADISSEYLLDEKLTQNKISEVRNNLNNTTDTNLIRRYSLVLNKLINLSSKITNSNEWNIKLIEYLDDNISDIRIFYKKVNFTEIGDYSYRIGIYIR